MLEWSWNCSMIVVKQFSCHFDPPQHFHLWNASTSFRRLKNGYDEGKYNRDVQKWRNEKKKQRWNETYCRKIIWLNVRSFHLCTNSHIALDKDMHCKCGIRHNNHSLTCSLTFSLCSLIHCSNRYNTWCLRSQDTHTHTYNQLTKFVFIHMECAMTVWRRYSVPFFNAAAAASDNCSFRFSIYLSTFLCMCSPIHMFTVSFEVSKWEHAKCAEWHSVFGVNFAKCVASSIYNKMTWCFFFSHTLFPTCSDEFWRLG